MTEPLSRRTLLRGTGTALGLPLLDAMLPAGLMPKASRGLAAEAADLAPRRAAFLYVPNGVHMQDWTPKQEGAGFDLPSTLEPLCGVYGKFSIHTGLAQKKAEANGDGAGDHARALATFLTGTQARKTAGADIRAGVSVDQIAAAHLGRRTRLPSLEIGTEGGGQSGNCDSGYSCVYSANIAWRSDTQSVPKESNPKMIFDRLFAAGRPGESEEARAKREKHSRSILDYVREEARGMERVVGVADRRKLDEYFTAVRELEQRLERFSGAASRDIGMERPEGPPERYEEHLRILADMLVLAFLSDTTRVSTCVFANEGSNKSYSFIGVPEGHHDLSHHGRNAEKQAKIQRINRFHVEQLAYLLDKLARTPEGEGTLLDNCMIVYGSGIGDGDRHNHDDLPILLAGGGGGALTPGRHVVHPKGTPLTNLYLAMLDGLGCPADRLGDSTGRLAEI
jgi:hypothetical protein